ncbi:MAG: DUF3472 domain-containing protein [Planctomycetia bacterium]|nr:DUF3472 domain-containing protein [Planctomycetia bacterium]
MDPADDAGHGADQQVVFFRLDRPATVRLSLRGRARQGTPGVVVRAGERTFMATFTGPEPATHELGELDVKQAGYVRVELARPDDEAAAEADVQALVIHATDEPLAVDFVRNNEGNMFYWGRRGPSVHLTYETPKPTDLQYAYSEITVPEGFDVQGSYFMANGFGEGYFGIQVNGPVERRVLFSVWSPFSTDNTRDIPEDMRVVKLSAGPDVHVGEFGNEGSGGQSYLIYPWKAGITYRFLTEVTPDPEAPGQTRYTAWFGDKAKQEWRLIASFRRPKTTTHLRGFHSFLENFNPNTGHLTRGADYGNVWVRDTQGVWHECTKARLSADATGRGRHRMDYDGGATGGRFFMKNCGFFAAPGKIGEVFTRDSTAADEPTIDFHSLPR